MVRTIRHQEQFLVTLLQHLEILFQLRIRSDVLFHVLCYDLVHYRVTALNGILEFETKHISI